MTPCKVSTLILATTKVSTNDPGATVEATEGHVASIGKEITDKCQVKDGSMFCHVNGTARYTYVYISRWWFQLFFIFIPTWGNDPI